MTKQTLMDEFELRNLAASEFESAMAFGISQDNFERAIRSALWRVQEAIGDPVLHLRLRNGEPDWAEDCVSPDNACIDGACEEDGITALKLYRLPLDA